MTFITKTNGILILLATLFFANCSPKVTDALTEVEAPTSLSGMVFENRTIDLGTIKKGETREITYVFKNKGTEPIEISQVSTCDCTEVLSRPYLPVEPGATGTIKVRFDSSKKDEVEPVEIDIWLNKEDPNTGMPVLERLEYIFKY